MNPFENINSYLQGLVLQHFSGSEIIELLSLVSPEWCEIVEKSKLCMNKVTFRYQVWRHQFFSSTEVFKTAAKSWRNYQHVVIELGVNDDLREFWNFMETTSRNLVTLKVENVRRFGNLERNLDFSNLEVFRAFSVDDKSLTTFLERTTKLKDLFIFSGESSIDQNVIDSVIKCLERNRNLEELYLKNFNFLNIFEEELMAKFKLKSLKLLNSLPHNSVSSEIEGNLIKFLLNCGSRLETFFFEFNSDQIVEIAFSLPALTSLGLLQVSSSVNLPKNFKIKNVEIPLIEEFSSIKKIVDATPNIESLFVSLVTDELIDHLAWNFMKLTSLNFKMISNSAEEHYEQLKRDHTEVNQLIDIWDYDNVDWD